MREEILGIFVNNGLLCWAVRLGRGRWGIRGEEVGDLGGGGRGWGIFGGDLV